TRRAQRPSPRSACEGSTSSSPRSCSRRRSGVGLHPPRTHRKRLMGKKSVEMLVGIFVLLGMAGLVFLALKAANLGTFSGGDTYTLRAYFDNIGALKVRAPVRSAGVTVGRVASIKLDPKLYQGVVELAIQRDVQFPTDSSLRILTSGLLGDQYVGVAPAPP